MSGFAPSSTVQPPPPPSIADSGPIGRYFRIFERGSTYSREIRGGVATFFTMAYILVLNPIILGSSTDKYGNHLSAAQLVTATALAAAVMTLLMGLGGNLPLAIGTGLGLNAVVAFQIAPVMSWPDAMGLVVLEGLGICVLVATGFRQAVMDVIPQPLKQAVSVGIGLLITFIGFVDSGFVSRVPDSAKTTTPVQLGADGTLTGWPLLVFCLGVLLTIALLTRRVKGAILISIATTTLLAIAINAAAGVPDADWGMTVPKLPVHLVASPDFGLIGHFSLLGGFTHAGLTTAIVFVFTLILSDFFDAMGTIVGVSSEAGLMDDQGRIPRIGQALFIDGMAAVIGGAASSSSNTAYVESAAGVAEGARTGLASIITGALFAVALFLAPLATIVPSQAATPALVGVGFLLMAQVRKIDWTSLDIAVPSFLTIAVMPFTYSISDGIGAGFISYVVIKAAVGKIREVHGLMWLVSGFFAVYFALDPIKELLGSRAFG
ncbi:NCS2 family permease [Streptomyces sp. RB6PN25]|uniref:NCS2 family permease n=1 Tax=Streptomyces humicola TaxID=2953240 RepID=A0ABT1PP05_9ACTN|nr:NCS2 family permease [Streptomyces humicola]MCQ4079406.1 NCS2 family permease [Streptomyces humicola]